MIFLIGAAALLAAIWGAGARTARGGRRAWAAIGVAALPLLALVAARDDLARYRFTLLAMRYNLQAADSLVVSGHAEAADLLVPGAGERPAAVLATVRDTALARVEARPRSDAGAVLMVEEERSLGRDAYHVVGSVPLDVGDTIEVAGQRLRAISRPERLGPLPLPWARVHGVELLPVGSRDANGDATGDSTGDATGDVGGDARGDARDDAPGDGLRRAMLPSTGGWRRYLAPRRPGVLERSYPLADLLDMVAPEDGGPRSGLSSFLFYDGRGRLSLALLDSEIRVGRSPAAVAVWTREAGGRRVLVAGLPHRDFPEADLTLPERYGVRPIRSFRFGVVEGWLEARPSRPEVHALDRSALAALDVAGGDPALGEYRVRVSPARGTLLRQAVVLRTPPLPFAAAGQAVFILPRDPSRPGFEVVTPSGYARWRVHHPISLGDETRSVLLRVDGQAMSARTVLAYTLLLGLAVAVFWLWPTGGRTYALAVLLLGLAGIRLLLGLSAHAELPFDQEAQQLALWLVPFMPWVAVVGGDIGAAVREARRDGTIGDATVPTRHAAFALALASLAWVLFADSVAKRLVLGALPVALVATVIVLRAAPGWVRRLQPPRLGTDAPATLRSAFLGPGLRLGAILFGARLVLAVAGAREQVVVLGTRLGLSVLYTPLSLAALTWILWCGARRLEGVRGGAADREGAWLLVNVGTFVVLAFAAVSVLISDYGILFTTLPGALALLVVLGWPWASRSTRPAVAGAVLAAPLVLFVAVQVAPSILHPRSAEDARRLEGGMAEWSRNELLLLEREDPQALRLIGQRRSESLAVMRETMRSYTRGNWTGKGFLRGRVSEEVRPTATREHAASALLAAQWGALGTGGLILLLAGFMVPLRSAVGSGPGPGTARQTLLAGAGFLAAIAMMPRPFGFVAALLLAFAALAVLLPALRGRPDSRSGDGRAALGVDVSSRTGFPVILAAVFLATIACAGIYMVLANYGWVLFTGKNVYLLGLDSVSDLVESTLLIVPAAAALAFGHDEGGVEPRRRA